MHVHLVDGTYELFRAWFGAPPARAADGTEVGASRGVLRTLIALVNDPTVTHVGVAFDHVIESFRNDLYAGYKTGAGLPVELTDQFPIVEEVTRALGMVTWPMVEFEADDALAAGAARFAADPRVDRVVIATPDKDLTQCVRGTRVVTWDRRRQIVLDEDGVRAKFGVSPASIPDYLGLVGDDADGFPGVPRWGAKSASTVLARYGHLEAIPDDPDHWDVPLRGAAALAESLRGHREEARLYRKLATLRTDVPLPEDLDAMRWTGARRERLAALVDRLGDPTAVARVPRWSDTE